MSFTLHGIPVSRGIAIGRAYLIAPAALDVDHYLIEPTRIEGEVERFRTAQALVHQELDELRADLSADAPSEMGAFIDVHTMILNDAMLVQETIDLIRTRRYNVEWALTEQLERLTRHFDEVEDEYLRERKADIEQVVERVLKALAGATGGLVNGIHGRCDEMIVVAHDIAPADMMQFKGQTFQGFVTDLGGRTSHTAIVARSLGIPATVGVQHASALIRQDDLIIVDGDHGIVIVDPAPIVLEEYSYRQSEKALEARKLQRLKFSPTQTVCGTRIDLCANIELPDDAQAALDAGATGIGLFRTEFLFMNQKGGMPEEEEQFAAYKRAVELMNGMPVTIRTIDVGADKPLDSIGDEFETAPNPALGLRAIRYSLSEPHMFLTQLRAILRASAFGTVKILIPMLAHAREIDQTLDLIQEAKRQLDDAGLAYDPNVRVGAMIEIPAAAIALPLFLKRLDFLSIGTNDLIQYTLAIDRADNAVAHLYDPLHPAVLHLIAFTLREAKRAGVPVSICGEMAGDPTLTRLLLGMGLTEFSMHPSQVLLVKQEVLRAHLKTLEKPVADVLAAFEPEEVQSALDRIAQA
ncbi:MULTISPECIES: phosphoenolpyruvate--protein phosphotransferase [Paraburkholderia]|uniref:Phosphoenolpyruvate-protein phosphotransferase n=1 Tax=Paraburkholderia largidicola TaxID=3014751 RepID=A0A7I8BFR2_9BURK|nr:MULTISPECIES: phosphoenolpyruvate--protein phosphotransferase [Paraburkholderia]BEU20136.1 phosphoenolpyruvate--protein phosphotransferase [Paraburkholderia sp. 22B1P]GJH34337.1 phosphoenolpyruvate--protein phosphotransferase [Paraburkholderia hospita]CAG9245790.1 Phosphoenolpyruvate-protein phosphotransferase [Paraburkholderia caribensis]BCF87229.1 phosphoenolpyruvate-protein phosphotransferase [Paraburkholderia sp. PGU16]GJG99302.1 phosphoenolpyruvate--protein phosphotransferase [Paraburk